MRGGEREDTDQNNKQLCERVRLVARECMRATEEEQDRLCDVDTSLGVHVIPEATLSRRRNLHF